MDDVIHLADAADAEGDAVEDTVLDINAAYWSAETEAARAEAAAAVAEADRLADALDVALARANASASHMAFLREQVAELGEDSRKLRARSEELEAELESTQEEMRELRRSTTYASLTDHRWLDDAGSGYRGVVRPQDSQHESDTIEVIATGADLDAIEAIDDDVVLASMRPVDEDEPPPAPTPSWTASDFGSNDDDLLPAPEPAKRRR